MMYKFQLYCTWAKPITFYKLFLVWTIGAAAWQNQQNDVFPANTQVSPVFAVRIKKPWVLGYPLGPQGTVCWVFLAFTGGTLHRLFCWVCHAAVQF